MMSLYHVICLLLACLAVYELAWIEEHLETIADKMTEDDE